MSTPTPLVQAALNGRTTRNDHPAVPVTAEQVVRDAIAVVAAGAAASSAAAQAREKVLSFMGIDPSLQA